MNRLTAGHLPISVRKTNSMGATSIWPRSDADTEAPGPAIELPKLALICDLLEEEWPSMDLVGNMIFEHLRVGHSGEFFPVLLRPSLRRRLTRFPFAGNSSFAR